MFSLNNFVNDINKVPSTWIFEYYLDLPVKLEGQGYRMKSLFNPHDKTPSMFLYYDGKSRKYKYKCFSTGNQGSAENLMSHLWNLDFGNTCKKILDDYMAYGSSCTSEKTLSSCKWNITNYELRKWNVGDSKYWTQYNIGSSMLERYNVKPLANYTLCKSIDDVITTNCFSSSHNYIYGYFDKSDTIYKIYEPLSKRKFTKVNNVIQGYDQLENKSNLLITSSLKDCMSIKSISGLDIDVIVPDSENTKFTKNQIEDFKNKYKAVITYMDSDEAGIKSMKFYFDNYNIPFCYIPKEKDFSDIVKNHGIKQAAYILIPVIDKAVEKYVDLHNKNNYYETLDLQNDKHQD